MLFSMLTVFIFILHIYNILSILLLMDTMDILVFYNYEYGHCEHSFKSLFVDMFSSQINT